MARPRPFLLAALSFVIAACSAASPSTVPEASSQASVAPSQGQTPDATEPATSAPTASGTSPAPGPAAWRELEPAGQSPAAREDATWTAQPDGRIAFLFGGRDGTTVFNDLWAFDLAAQTWTELTPAGDPPPERFGHESVWVEGIGVVVYAGQAGPSTFFDDLWAYDPEVNRWRALPAEGARPKARYGTCAALGPDGRLWISHGFTEDGTRFADTQAFDFATNRWTDETPTGRAPVNRCLHGCWWTADERFALYAGQTTGVTALGDLWTLAGPGTSDGAWNQIAGELPPDRNLYAFASHGDAVVVTGGLGLDGSYLDDTFAFDDRTLAVEAIPLEGETPPGRAGAMLIDDPKGGRVIQFGGKDGDGALADLWELTLP